MKARLLMTALAVALCPALARAGGPEDQGPGGAEVGAGPSFPPFARVAEDMAESSKGFYTLHHDKKRLKGLFEVPPNRLKRPFLLATSFSGGSTFAGYQWGNALVYWTVQDNRLLLIEKNVRYRSKKGDPVTDAVDRTYTDQLLLSLRILTKSPRGGYVISLNELFARSAPRFFGGAAARLDPSLAVFPKLKSFPENNEVAVTMPERGGGAFVTLHYSLRMLPKTPYKPREADDRVGYFLTVAKDYSRDPKDDHFSRFINRWDLQKLDPKLAASPVKDPIVFYIEKTVPVEYRRYVREGILEWNKAFEKLGFLDAVQVRQQTATNEFKDFDPEDARYNFFRWITSGRAFAMGPSRVNPLTGQILDADILFDDAYSRYHFTTQRRYPIKGEAVSEPWRAFLNDPSLEDQLFPELTDPRGPQLSGFDKAVAEQMKARLGEAHVCTYSREMGREMALARLARPSGVPGLDYAGAMIRNTVTHEVGHTLGLRHNFVASTWRNLGEVNCDDRPSQITGSIMDYNPVNLANKGEKQGYYQTQGIGPYDFWAVEFGYHPTKNPKDLVKILAKVAQPGHDFATDQDASGPDPYVNRYDFADPLDFARSRTKLAGELLADVEKRSLKEGESYEELRANFSIILSEISRSAGFASRFIGGVRIYRDHYKDPNGREPIQPVAAAKQRAALTYLCQEIFVDKNFDFSPRLLRCLGGSHWSDWGARGRVGAINHYDTVLGIQARALFAITDGGPLRRLTDAELYAAESEDVLAVDELFETLTASIMTELGLDAAAGAHNRRKPFVSAMRRNLQRAYVGRMIDLALDRVGGVPRGARTLAWSELRRLDTMIGVFLERNEAKLDRASAAHLAESRTRIKRALEASYQLGR